MSEDWNPSVPIVEEIRQELLRAAELADARDAAGGRPRRRLAPSAAPGRGRPARRVARRVAVLATVIALIGGVALAAHLGSSGDGPPADTRPAPIARGRDWILSGFRHEDRLCVELRAGAQLSVDCASAPGPLRVTSGLSGGERLVGGLTGPGVRTVRARVAGRERSDPTRPAPAAEGAGLPQGARWFLLSFPHRDGGAERAPARVLALGAGGRPFGHVKLDCSLSALDPACVRAAGGQAAAELR